MGGARLGEAWGGGGGGLGALLSRLPPDDLEELALDVGLWWGEGGGGWGKG